MVVVWDRSRDDRCADGEAHIVGAGPIPVAEARRLAERSFLKVVIHDGVRIDTVKHIGRYIPVELRTALELGDPPAFDGMACVDCSKRFGIERDHVNPVTNGGPTSHANLRGRCYEATSGRPNGTAGQGCWAPRGLARRRGRATSHQRKEPHVAETQQVIVDYDPEDEVSVTARAQLLSLPLPVARWRDRGELPGDEEVAVFNHNFNEMFWPAHDDLTRLAVLLMELILAVHRALGLFADGGGSSAEAILREVIC
jgi:hypothetical protein